MESYTKEDEKLFWGIQQAVRESVEKEVITLTKAGTQIDLNALTDKHTQQFFRELEKGLDKLFPEDDLSRLREQLGRDDPALFEEIEKKSKQYKERFQKEKSEHKTFEELKNLSQDFLSKEELHKIQDLAETSFDRKEFEKAGLYFMFLSGIASPDPYIWVMRGLCAQNRVRYEEALLSYFLALQTDSHNFLAYLQMIEVLALMGKIEEASDLFSFIDANIKHEYRDNPIYLSRIESIGAYLGTNKKTHGRS